MLKTKISSDSISIGDYLSISFIRTFRFPDDGKTYPLPNGYGSCPVYNIAVQGGGIFIPMFLSEAMWIKFSSTSWHPNAVKVGVGGINVINGKDWDSRIKTDENDYVVCPPQEWLDGIYVGNDQVRQFVTVLPNSGESLESKIKGCDSVRGIQISVFDAKKNTFPMQKPNPIGDVLFQSAKNPKDDTRFELVPNAKGLGNLNKINELVISGGGKIKQKIYEDPHGVSVWDNSNYGIVNVFIVSVEEFLRITGKAPISSPITYEEAQKKGMPWFKLYDEELESIKQIGIKL
jgi:hypothetical protein